MVLCADRRKRCDVCRLFSELCICAQLPQLTLRTGVTLVMSHREFTRPTNTGRLLAACLSGSRLVLQGADTPLFEDTEEPLLLYPNANAVPITNLVGEGRSYRLIVPDGTWPESRRIAHKPNLRSLPCVSLPPQSGGFYRLRVNGQEGTMATMEAVAVALGLLESAEVGAQLADLCRVMSDRFLWMRGQLRADQVFGGLPEHLPKVASALPRSKA